MTIPKTNIEERTKSVQTSAPSSRSVAVDEALAALERIRGAADTVALAVGRSGHKERAIVSTWMQHIRGLATRAGCRLTQARREPGCHPGVIKKTVHWRHKPLKMGEL